MATEAQSLSKRTMNRIEGLLENHAPRPSAPTPAQSQEENREQEEESNNLQTTPQTFLNISTNSGTDGDDEDDEASFVVNAQSKRSFATGGGGGDASTFATTRNDDATTSKCNWSILEEDDDDDETVTSDYLNQQQQQQQQQRSPTTNRLLLLATSSGGGNRTGTSLHCCNNSLESSMSSLSTHRSNLTARSSMRSSFSSYLASSFNWTGIGIKEEEDEEEEDDNFQVAQDETSSSASPLKAAAGSSSESAVESVDSQQQQEGRRPVTRAATTGSIKRTTTGGMGTTGEQLLARQQFGIPATIGENSDEDKEAVASGATDEAKGAASLADPPPPLLLSNSNHTSKSNNHQSKSSLHCSMPSLTTSMTTRSMFSASLGGGSGSPLMQRPTHKQPLNASQQQQRQLNMSPKNSPKSRNRIRIQPKAPIDLFVDSLVRSKSASRGVNCCDNVGENEQDIDRQQREQNSPTPPPRSTRRNTEIEFLQDNALRPPPGVLLDTANQSFGSLTDSCSSLSTMTGGGGVGWGESMSSLRRGGSWRYNNNYYEDRANAFGGPPKTPRRQASNDVPVAGGGPQLNLMSYTTATVPCAAPPKVPERRDSMQVQQQLYEDTSVPKLPQRQASNDGMENTEPEGGGAVAIANSTSFAPRCPQRKVSDDDMLPHPVPDGAADTNTPPKFPERRLLTGIRRGRRRPSAASKSTNNGLSPPRSGAAVAVVVTEAEAVAAAAKMTPPKFPQRQLSSDSSLAPEDLWPHHQFKSTPTPCTPPSNPKALVQQTSVSPLTPPRTTLVVSLDSDIGGVGVGAGSGKLSPLTPPRGATAVMAAAPAALMQH